MCERLILDVGPTDLNVEPDRLRQLRQQILQCRKGSLYIFAADIAFVGVEALGFIQLVFKRMLHTLRQAFGPGLLVVIQGIRALSESVLARVAVPLQVSSFRGGW